MKTRRTAVSVALLTVFALSACTSGDGDPTDSPSPRGSTVQTASEPPADSEPPGDSEEPVDDEAREPDDASAESRKPDKAGRQRAVFKRVEGNDTGDCIDATGRRNVKSGGFMAGPFDDAVTAWGKASDGLKRNEIRLYWVPLHAKKMPGVTITARQRGGTGRVTVTEDAVGEAESWKYYPVTITLPEAGTWVLRGKAGRDAGCFTLTVG